MKDDTDYESMSIFEQVKTALGQAMAHGRGELTLKTTTLPLPPAEQLPQDSEMLEDIRAYDAAKTRKEEAFPAEVAERLVAGGNPIRVFRDYRGLTQEQLAKAAKIARAYLAEIESGRKVGSISVLRAIAAALKVDLDDIAG